jgi:hypothetical protein
MKTKEELNKIWDESKILDGLTGSIKDKKIAELYESQLSHIISENSSGNTNAEQLIDIPIPLIKTNVFGIKIKNNIKHDRT